MPIGQYTPQTALGRVDLGMRAATAGKDPTAELQTLAMNDQLLRQREQDMHLQALEAQAKQQEAMQSAQSAETKRLAGIATGVQDYLGTHGQSLSDLRVAVLRRSPAASPDEVGTKTSSRPRAIPTATRNPPKARSGSFKSVTESIFSRPLDRARGHRSR